jgi:hypothetical protein
VHGVTTNTIDARARLLKAVLPGGLTAGVLDIADALIFHGARGVAPLRILQAIASGLLGREAFAGGAWTAALGLGVHFFIAATAAAVYAIASLRLPVLVQRPFQCGAAFGLAVYAVMQYVVLPLSAFRPGPVAAPGTIDWGLVNLLLAHVFCVGVPIALSTRWAARRELPI